MMTSSKKSVDSFKENPQPWPTGMAFLEQVQVD
jgi:hypothetical protein